jgi:hypothetical protein
MSLLSRVETTLRMATVRPRYALDAALFRLGGRSAALLPLRRRHAGRPMLVVGNGPSLNRTPLDRFAHVPAIGMNKISLLFPRTTWRPGYIMACNNPVVQQHAEFFRESEIPILLAYKCRWFLGRGPRRNVGFYNMFPDPAFSTDFSRGVGMASTVSYVALQFAYYLGADPVIIFGIDHNFQHRPDSHQAYQKMEGGDPNHFDPNYFAHGVKWGLPDLDNDRRLFRLAKAAFEADGRRIFDATVDGKLPVYDKLSVGEALELCAAGSPAKVSPSVEHPA